MARWAEAEASDETLERLRMQNQNLQKLDWLKQVNRLEPADAAVEYARHGWRVFPCGGGKPLVNNYRAEATADEETIRRWWSEHEYADIGALVPEDFGIIIASPDKSASTNAELLPLTAGFIDDETRQFLFYRVAMPLPSCELRAGLQLTGSEDMAVLPPSLMASGIEMQWDESPQCFESMPKWVTPRVEDVVGEGFGLESANAYSSQLAVGPEPTPQHGKLIRAADVEPERVSWLWPGRLPAGKIVLLDGDPGLGKSTITLDIAARVTTGDVMPDESTSHLTEPASVLLLSSEDGFADTIVPRFKAADGDLQRLLMWPKDNLPRIPSDVDEIKRLAISNHVKLLIIDPLIDFIASKLKSERDQDMRQALSPLAAMAEETGCTVLGIRHLKKDRSETNAVYRGGGSIGISGAARVGLLVSRLAGSDDETECALAVFKNNLAPSAKSLTYRIEQQSGSSRIRWTGESALFANDLLASTNRSVEASAVDIAAMFLQKRLEDGERHTVKQVVQDAASKGIAGDTLKRAKRLLGVEMEHTGFGENTINYWRLPPD